MEPARTDGPDLKRLAAEMEISEEEVARLLNSSGPTYTTEEVLAYVKGRRK